jgi:hypothetical protein
MGGNQVNQVKGGVGAIVGFQTTQVKSPLQQINNITTRPHVTHGGVVNGFLGGVVGQGQLLNGNNFGRNNSKNNNNDTNFAQKNLNHFQQRSPTNNFSHNSHFVSPNSTTSSLNTTILTNNSGSSASPVSLTHSISTHSVSTLGNQQNSILQNNQSNNILQNSILQHNNQNINQQTTYSTAQFNPNVSNGSLKLTHNQSIPPK